MFRIILLSLAASLLLLSSCKKDTGSDNAMTCTKDYEQTALLTNIAESLILPAYQDFSTKVASLKSDLNSLTTAPNQAKLEATRNSFKNAYLAFQTVAQYEFGPAETQAFRNSLNNFPIDAPIVNNNIQTGVYDFSFPDRMDKGFPALDYLLYGYASTDRDLINEINSNNKLAVYLTKVLEDIETRTSNVLNEWGNYKATFISNTGTAAGTSLGQIINQLNQNFEITKRDRIAQPAGALSVSETPFPEAVEAFYSGISLELMTASVQASKDLYNGLNGEGLDNLLQYIAAKDAEGADLNSIILNRFTQINSQINNLTGRFSDAVQDAAQKPMVAQLNAVAAESVRYMKVDMPSVLCISITYIDNPSDSD